MLSKKVKSVLVAVVLFAILEAITFYIYTWLFMLEGQPLRHADPQLRRYASICLAAMFVELLGGLLWIVRILGS